MIMESSSDREGNLHYSYLGSLKFLESLIAMLSRQMYKRYNARLITFCNRKAIECKVSKEYDVYHILYRRLQEMYCWGTYKHQYIDYDLKQLLLSPSDPCTPLSSALFTIMWQFGRLCNPESDYTTNPMLGQVWLYKSHSPSWMAPWFSLYPLPSTAKPS